MCHGHPRYHLCAHTSINWFYCPTALIDLETGYETPCSNVSFAPAQRSTLDCPLAHCDFKGKDGRWICCVCKQGPNAKGWCLMPMRHQRHNHDTLVLEEFETTCDHGCCKECQKLGPSRSPSPELAFSDLRKGSASRKFGYGAPPRAHRRSAYSIIGGGYTTPERDGDETSTATPSSTSGDSHQGRYQIELDYRSAKRPKTSKKGHKSRARRD